MKYLIFFLTVVFLSCGDKKFTEKDLNQNPKIKPFILNNKEFSGEHNLDLGKVEIIYKPLMSLDSCKIVIKNNAIHDNWKIFESNYNKIIFIKKLQLYPNANSNDTVRVFFKKDNIKIKWN
jgi:hypothetical protein